MITMEVRESLRIAMTEEMRRDDTVFVMGEEVANYDGAYKVTRGLLKEFGPERVIDTPISEYGFAGIGVGAAFMGMRPIVEFMTFNFAMQAVDHIVNSAAKTHYMSGGVITCPIVFRGPNGFAPGVGAQHSQCFASWYAHIPGLRVIAPRTAADCKGLLKSAIRDNGPVIFLENETLYGLKEEVPDDPDFLIPMGKAAIAREGKDISIISFSAAIRTALAAADVLRDENDIDVEVIDLRSLRPLDEDSLVKTVKKTGRVLILEEGWGFSGIGSEISAVISENAFDWLDCPVTRHCAVDVPMPYSKVLENAFLPSIDSTVSKVREMFNIS